MTTLGLVFMWILLVVFIAAGLLFLLLYLIVRQIRCLMLKLPLFKWLSIGDLIKLGIRANFVTRFALLTLLRHKMLEVRLISEKGALEELRIFLLERKYHARDDANYYGYEVDDEIDDGTLDPTSIFIDYIVLFPALLHLFEFRLLIKKPPRRRRVKFNWFNQLNPNLQSG